MTVYTDEEIRKILLEHRFLLTLDEVATKYGLSRYRLRKWKREHSFGYLRIADEEVALAGLYQGITTIPLLIEFVDYVHKSRYTEPEMREMLGGLVHKGMVRTDGNLWSYNHDRLREGRGFVF